MGLFDFLTSETDQKNEFQPTNFGQTQNYNANAFQYGGQPGGAEAAAQGYGLMGRQAQGRDGVGLNTMQADQSRAGMGQAAGLMMGRATGATPSIAGMQAQQDMQRAVAAQSSAAAGARGPAALALAQQNAAGNTANAQSAISGQAQINSAQERLAAEQAAFGAYGGMRGADEQRAMGQAQLMDAQRGRNDAFQMGMTQNEMAVRQAQMQGQMAQQGLLAGSHQQGQQLGAGIAGQNAQQNSNMFNTVLGLGVGAASAAGGMPSDARAKMGAQPIGGGLMMSDVTSKVGIAQLGGPFGGGGPMMQRTLGGGSGPSDGGTVGGAFHSGTNQMGAGGGMDPMSMTKWNNRELQGMARDPSGGMTARGGPLAGVGQMLSDDRAKVRDAERQAYLLGRAHEMEGSQEFSYGGRPREGEEIRDMDPWQSDARRAEQRPEWLEGYMHEQGGQSARAGLATGMDPLSDRAGGLMRRGLDMGGAAERPEWLADYMGGQSGRAGLATGLAPLSDRAGGRMRRGVDFGGEAPSESRAGDFYAAQPDMAGAAGDRMTGQLARGLQPYAYEYKPGFGTEGQKVGPMAQEMAANDVTSTAVRRDPQSGLMSIDRDDGLKVALGGVGHLASKQSQQEELIAALLADRDRPSRRY